MGDEQKPRHVKARRWVMAGAVATAVAGASASADASGAERSRKARTGRRPRKGELPRSRLPQARAREKAVRERAKVRAHAQFPPEIQLLTDIGFMQGHAYAGLKLYEMGKTELGIEHIGHPIEEKYDAVAKPVEKMGFGLKAQLSTR